MEFKRIELLPLVCKTKIITVKIKPPKINTRENKELNLD